MYAPIVLREHRLMNSCPNDTVPLSWHMINGINVHRMQKRCIDAAAVVHLAL